VEIRDARATDAPAIAELLTGIDLSSADDREDAHAFYHALGFRSRSRSFTKPLR
jgi:hypothetical protein